MKHLVDTFTDMLIETDREGIAEGSRAEIDRIESLIWIGRDRIDQLTVDIEQRFAVDAATRKAETDIIKAAGRDYEEKLRSWNAVSVAAEREPDNAARKNAEQIAEDAHDAARDDLFAFTPTTPAGFAESASRSSSVRWAEQTPPLRIRCQDRPFAPIRAIHKLPAASTQTRRVFFVAGRLPRPLVHKLRQ